MAQEQATNVAEAMQEQWRANIAAAQDQFVQNVATAQEQTQQVTVAMQDQLRQNVATAQGQAQQAVAAAQEQFRQNLATVQGEWQRIGGQTRQAWTEPFTAIQQTQEALFAGSERLSEQGVETATAAFEATWESWLALFGMVGWSQDQAEQGLRRLLEQGRTSRDEGTRLLRELGEQNRRNGQEFQRMLLEGVRAGQQALRFPETFGAMIPAAPASPAITPDQVEALSRKLDALEQKLDALTAARPTVAKATK
jgi:hypothetical protein